MRQCKQCIKCPQKTLHVEISLRALKTVNTSKQGIGEEKKVLRCFDILVTNFRHFESSKVLHVTFF